MENTRRFASAKANAEAILETPKMKTREAKPSGKTERYKRPEGGAQQRRQPLNGRARKRRPKGSGETPQRAAAQGAEWICGRKSIARKFAEEMKTNLLKMRFRGYLHNYRRCHIDKK